MNPLKIGISGVRGIVGETFTPHLVVQFTEAFATYVGRGDVYICNDARPSGHMVRGAVIAGLLGAGCSPVDFGVCPIPTLQHAISGSNAIGGIAISAGHNPEDWNALKFIRGDGLYFNAHQGDELLDVYHFGHFDKAAWNEIVPLKTSSNGVKSHLAAICAVAGIERDFKAGFKIALDTCNGACSKHAEALLSSLGCNVVVINDEPGETMPHAPEPNPSNMSQLRALIRATGFDAGFMLDTAGERLGIVTNAGDALPEDRTLAICTAIQMERKPGKIVTNLCTTRAINDIARKHKVEVISTQIGQAYVAETAMKYGAVIAGEGSGGVIIPEIQYANDGLAAIAFILDHLAKKKTSLSKLNGSLPEYVTIKKNIPLDYTLIFKVIQQVRKAAQTEFSKAKVNLSDGIKLEWGSSWLHIRPSNTESLIRLIAEAKTERRANQLIDLGRELVGR